MTARPLIVPGAMPSRDANGRALAAKLRFYTPATTTYKAVYTDNTLTNQFSQPILSDSAGRWPSMWADDAQIFDAGWSDQVFDETIETFANLSPANDAVLASTAMAQGSADAAAASASAAAASAATLSFLATGDFGGLTLSNIAQITVLSGPTADLQVATKGYVDGVAFAMAGGALPGQTGNAGKFLTTNGVSASWGSAVNSLAGLSGVVTGAAAKTALAIQSTDLVDLATYNAARRAEAIAFAVSL